MTAYDPAQVHLAGQLDDMEARAIAAETEAEAWRIRAEHSDDGSALAQMLWRKTERERDRLATQALHFRERAITAEATVARVGALVKAADWYEARVVDLRDLRAALGGESTAPPSVSVECCASGRCEVCAPGYDWGRDG